MSIQSWQETLITQQLAGTSFGSFTTAKSVIPPTSLITLPAAFWALGKMMRVKVAGAIGTLVTTPGTITFQVMHGSIVVFTTGAIQLNATAHTAIPFELEVLLTCRIVGSGTTAKLMGQGKVLGIMFTPTAAQVDGVNSHAAMMAPNTTPANGTGFDSTIANILDFWAGFSISNAANTVLIEQYSVESLN